MILEEATANGEARVQLPPKNGQAAEAGVCLPSLWITSRGSCWPALMRG